LNIKCPKTFLRSSNIASFEKFNWFCRGHESAELVEPWKKNIRLLGLGTTVGTPEDGISAEAIVVKSFADLYLKRESVSNFYFMYSNQSINPHAYDLESRYP